MNNTTQTIEEDDSDNRRASIINFDNNRVALQCATQYVIAANQLYGLRDGIEWDSNDITKFADKFKKWLNEA